MKKNHALPHQSTATGAARVNSVIPSTGLTPPQALRLMDFSTSPPTWTVDTAAISEKELQKFGLCILDGLDSSLLTHDTATFMQCCRALRECLNYNIEDHRMKVTLPGSNIVAVMTLFQTAAFLNHLDVCEQLFEYALTLPASVLRQGLDSPFSMVCKAFKMIATQGTGQSTALATDILNRFADHLALTEPTQVDPALGMLFHRNFTAKVGPDMVTIHQALVARHKAQIAGGTPTPRDAASQSAVISPPPRRL